MNSNTANKIGAGAATVIAASFLTLSPYGADARVCLGAQDEAQCVVTPPASSSAPPHYCPVINGASLCASDADLGLTGGGGTFVAGVYIPDFAAGGQTPEVYVPDIVTGDPATDVINTPDVIIGGPPPEIYVPDINTGGPPPEIYIPDIVTGDPQVNPVDRTGDGCFGAPTHEIVACPG